MNKIIYGGISSADYSIYVLDVQDEKSTKRSYESVTVLGKTGDSHFDNGRYENITRVARCVCMEHADFWIEQYIADLLSLTGYQRLEDDMYPEYYKLGAFIGEVSPKYKVHKNAGQFDIAFDCKPQRWLKTGEEQFTISGTSASLYNPTKYSAYPLLEITGNGNIGIGSQTITIANNPSTLMLDCELGDAYAKTGHTNYNQYVTITNADFPVLEAGTNGITKPSGMTLKITPRWWTL
jgi:phage-related protein